MDIARVIREGSSAEKAGLGVLSSFASTIFVARAVNYLRERQRGAPRARSVGRRLREKPRTGGVRVHHFVPGLALAFAAGAIAIVLRTEGEELRFSIPFGVGTGLTFDELALLVDLDNAYWRTENMALAQAALAAIAAAGLGVRIARRGAAPAES